MQKELRGVKKPQEALRSRVRKQQNQLGNVRNPQESSGSYKTKVTSMTAFLKERWPVAGQGEDVKALQGGAGQLEGFTGGQS